MKILALLLLLVLCVLATHTCDSKKPKTIDVYTNPHYKTESPLLALYPDSGPGKSMRKTQVPLDKSAPLTSNYITVNAVKDYNETTTTFTINGSAMPSAFSGRSIVDMTVGDLVCNRDNYTKFELSYEGAIVVIFDSPTDTESGLPCVGPLNVFYVDDGADGSSQSCNNALNPISAGYVKPKESLLAKFGGLDATLGVWTAVIQHSYHADNLVCALSIGFYFASPDLDEPPHQVGTNMFGTCQEVMEPFGFSIPERTSGFVETEFLIPQISDVDVVDISVGVQIQDQRAGNLQVALSNTATSVALLNNSCPSDLGRDVDAIFGINQTDYVCSNGRPLFYGDINPDGNLSQFLGELVPGVWTINVSRTDGYAGFVYRLCLWLTYKKVAAVEEVEDPNVAQRREFLLYFGLWFYFFAFILINNFADYAVNQVRNDNSTLSGFGRAAGPANGPSRAGSYLQTGNFVLSLIACICALLAAYSLAIVIPKPTPLGTLITFLVLFLLLHYLVNYLAIQFSRFTPNDTLVASDEINMYRFLMLGISAAIVIAFIVLAFLWGYWSLVAFNGVTIWWEIVTSCTFMLFFIAYAVMHYIIIGRVSGSPSAFRTKGQ